jgi:hypothetical protein
MRNGEAIIGLQAVGTAIPGNEPYNVDNLVRLSGSQLTGDGFGYQTKPLYTKSKAGFEPQILA